ncbi:class I SAM-dependent methyltransferase [Actinoplanes subtropicus]|uniref:class I SAM-dependent methyltransferase n=1 Tax=Actinoplanes subtropicus TaxID=543632 RepID=UPI00068AFE87|nr:class I SAM-dependent methyltransferase [Actinoplanes subtropicus]
MAASRTALIAAALRMTHRSDDDSPPVLDDPFAEVLLGADAAALAAVVRELPRQALLVLRSTIVGRSRVAEDRLRAVAAAGPARYVSLGAGLDSVAWRHTDLDLEVVEIDQPDSAADKLRRVRAAGLGIPGNWRQLPCDLTTEPLADVLKRAAPGDGGRATVISWLGVTQYLTPDAVGASLAGLATAPSGTEIVLTTLIPDADVAADDLESVRLVASIVEAGGEPWLTRLTRRATGDLITGSGLRPAGEVGAPHLVEPLFAGRADGLVANAVELVTVARVP